MKQGPAACSSPPTPCGDKRRGLSDSIKAHHHLPDDPCTLLFPAVQRRNLQGWAHHLDSQCTMQPPAVLQPQPCKRTQHVKPTPCAMQPLLTTPGGDTNTSPTLTSYTLRANTGSTKRHHSQTQKCDTTLKGTAPGVWKWNRHALCMRGTQGQSTLNKHSGYIPTAP